MQLDDISKIIKEQIKEHYIEDGFKDYLIIKDFKKEINRIIENIIRLQTSQDIKENIIPNDVSWDYGLNERVDDLKKLDVLQKVQRTMSVPYSVRAEIVLPVLNKIADNPIELERLIKDWQEETNKIDIEYGEL